MLNVIRNLVNPPNPIQILQTAPKPTSKVNPTQKGDTPTEEQKNNLRVAKLIMVTANNNNKFYEMRENSDGTFTAHYGRVGAKSSTATYSINQWDKKLREKVRKGYKDQTHLFSTKVATSEFAEIDDKLVQQLLNDLMRFARQSISTNYNVSAADVTKKQVEEAQNLLDELTKGVKLGMDAASFNKQLIELFAIIPRKMARVKEHLIETPINDEDVNEIETKMAEEQATLDVMRGQVELHEKQAKNEEEPVKQTLLDAFGLQMETVDDKKMITQIKKMMGPHSNRFHKAYKVVNVKTQGHFDNFISKSKNKKTELFWHGSRNENWLSIIKTGLVLRPANAVITGKMFGYGLYFADKFKKSLNYTSLRGSYWANGSQDRGYLALYDVHVGNQFKIQKHQPWCYQLTEQNLKKQGKDYDSLYAKGGADLINNEYIVYNHNQCTVRYLVEVR